MFFEHSYLFCQVADPLAQFGIAPIVGFSCEIVRFSPLELVSKLEPPCIKPFEFTLVHNFSYRTDPSRHATRLSSRLMEERYALPKSPDPGLPEK